jgi:hypothetical protein
MLKYIKHSIACIALFSFWHAVNAFEYVGGAQSGFEQSQESCEVRDGLEQHMLNSVENNNIDFSNLEGSENSYGEAAIDRYEDDAFEEHSDSTSEDAYSAESSDQQSEAFLPESIHQENTSQEVDQIDAESNDTDSKPEFIEWMLQKHKLPSLHFLDVLEIIDN